MKLDANKLTSAVRLALTMGTVASVGVVGTAYAQNADTTENKSQNLETIVVTGSNIRRVDIETANPVLTIDHAQIQQSGKVNLGDLIQQLPSMAGNAMNPQVNNGGTGAAGVSLRGLGSNRTLLLINGHRIPFQLQDLNLLPVSAVERIEVLNDGASATYGSDAIAGVVNIITRTNYQGAEVGADYGISDRDDGERKAIHMLFGQSTDKGSIMLGVQYDKQDPVSAANRNFSKSAQYIYNHGINANAGSSRTPGGRYFLPAGSPILAQLGCTGTSVTLSGRQLPSTGNPPSATDFRCYNSASDSFNFQAVGNYDLIPNERTGIFALGNYKLTDHVEMYAEVIYHKMAASQQLAPYPFDLSSNNVVIPADQYYNPFGIEFGTGGSSGRTIALRLSSLGNRGLKIANTTEMGNFGFRGSLGESNWNWDAHFSYGKLSQQTQNLNYLNFSQLVPSLECTKSDAAAGNCQPLDIFNQTDPSAQKLLQAAKINPFSALLYQVKSAEASINNASLFSLPAGDVGFALGASDRKEYVNNRVDPLTAFTFSNGPDGPILNCPGPNSICSSPGQGGFSVKEAYAEMLIPVLKDLPFIHSLNIDLGDRYSKYSNFGSTNNWKVAIEYKPIEDLLIRGTVSKVFRAPTATNLYGGPTGDAPTAADPCVGLTGNPNCPKIPVPPQPNGQLTGYTMGSQFANRNGLSNAVLLPENGKSFSYGFVYDPNWLPGLSVNADYYRILLANLIVSGPGIAQTILTQCFNTGGAICSNVVRGSDGLIRFVIESPFNSGNLVDQGFDIGVHYKLPETAFGNFRVGFDGTYIQKYNITQGGFTQGLAGHYDKTYGNFARIRGLATVDWNLGAFTANWTTRYVGPITYGYANAGLGPSALDGNDGSDVYTPNPISSVQHAASVTTSNFSVGYNIEPINTFISVGIDNVFDRQPPVLYQNNVLNANTDVSTYDLLGRYYHASVTVKF